MVLIGSLAASAAVHLGEQPDPVSGTQTVQLEQARLVIDFLGTLQEKTRGNLTPEEEQGLNDLLYSLRLAFLKKSGP